MIAAAAAQAAPVAATLEQLVEWMSTVFVIPNFTQPDHVFTKAGKTAKGEKVCLITEIETGTRWRFVNKNLYIIMQTPPLSVLENEGIYAEYIEAKLVSKAQEYIAGILSEQVSEGTKPWLLFRWVPDLQKNMDMTTLCFTIVLRLRFSLDGMDFPSERIVIPFDIQGTGKAIVRR